ncbi:MAG: hypothetical protein GY696_02540 [Gammaproteobacteria bacterium]|nr:hypothetical protein [Gammaproteobacteria bacterium]
MEGQPNPAAPPNPENNAPPLNDERQGRRENREAMRELQEAVDLGQQRNEYLANQNQDLNNQVNEIQHALVAQAMRPLANLPGPKPFKGKRHENFRRWLEKLELYMNNMRLVDDHQKQSFLATYLEDQAERIYLNLPLHDRSSYEAVKTAMAEKLEDPLAATREFMSLLHIKQLPDQTVAEFCCELESKLRAAKPDEDHVIRDNNPLIRSLFINGLCSDLSLTFEISEPPTYELAVRKAQSIEAIQNKNADLRQKPDLTKNNDPTLQLLTNLTATLAGNSAQSLAHQSAKSP